MIHDTVGTTSAYHRTVAIDSTYMRQDEEGVRPPDSDDRILTSLSRYFVVDTEPTATRLSAESAASVRDSAEPRQESGPKKEAAIRLQLLLRQSRSKLNLEESARFHVATERLRALSPRVRATDLERLADAKMELNTINESTNDLAREFGIAL